MTDARSRLIVALDVPDRVAARAAIDRLAGHAGLFKIGLELFVKEGPRIVEEVRALGFDVFLDLKLHDIPNTVAGAVRSACSLDIRMLTLHAAGGTKMMESARQAVEETSGSTLLLAVTALTSLGNADLNRMGIAEPPGNWVRRLAQIAAEAGIHGLVAAPQEIAGLRTAMGRTVKIVVPGIRPAGSTAQDQARVAAPRDAILAGADYIVVGRPILHDPQPELAAERIIAEIEDAMSSVGA